MNKIFKGLGVFGMAALASFSLASCDGSNADKVNVIIGCYMTRGNTYESLINYLDSIKDDLNFEYRTVLISQTDAQENLSTFQTALETGTDVVITMMDNNLENTKAILEACNEAGAYFAGWQTDFNNSRNDSEFINDDHFLGAATDGDINGASLGQWFFNKLSESDNRNIALCRTPSYAYPSGLQATNEFKRLADEWNESHPDDQFNIIYANKTAGTDDYSYDMGFGGNLDATVLDGWLSQGLDAIVAVNSLAVRIYNTLAERNVDETIDLYTVGWDEAIIPYVGDDKTIKSLGQSPVETIVYPLVLGINAARGTQFTDMPSGEDKLVIGQRVMIGSDEDLAAGRENCMIYSTDYSASHALISGEELKEYLGDAEGASFAKLKGLIDSWDSDYVLYRK